MRHAHASPFKTLLNFLYRPWYMSFRSNYPPTAWYDCFLSSRGVGGVSDVSHGHQLMRSRRKDTNYVLEREDEGKPPAERALVDPKLQLRYDLGGSTKHRAFQGPENAIKVITTCRSSTVCLCNMQGA